MTIPVYFICKVCTSEIDASKNSEIANKFFLCDRCYSEMDQEVPTIMKLARETIDIQANSFPCKICGEIYTEESGATENFICDNCVTGE